MKDLKFINQYKEFLTEIICMVFICAQERTGASTEQAIQDCVSYIQEAGLSDDDTILLFKKLTKRYKKGGCE